MNSFFNNPASSTQRAENTSSACNTKLSALDDADHNANALLEDLLQDIPEIAITYHGIKAESTENSKKNVENNLSEQEQLGFRSVSFPPSATNRVKNEKIFATTATQTDIPKVKDAVIQTIQTNPYPKLSSITFDLNCNQSRGFRELGQLLLDPSLSLPMKYYCLQKICKTHFLAQPDLRTATNCIPYMPLIPTHDFSSNFHNSIFQIMQNIFTNNNQAQMLSHSGGNRCRVRTDTRQIYRRNFYRGRRKRS